MNYTQTIFGHNVEEKLHLGVCKPKGLNTNDLPLFQRNILPYVSVPLQMDVAHFFQTMVMFCKTYGVRAQKTVTIMQNLRFSQ
jgi:hypothetical protein